MVSALTVTLAGRQESTERRNTQNENIRQSVRSGRPAACL